ncbi:GspE/PulE family protein [Thiohalophilus thiocyanatoxydans]|uniref:General secretion pathway protein E n=1 Tax=Thiohalophilus thiocyanatoxydans TaxID=381308 RepID=A0A4R8IKD4_9GAMM|nr:ATPase, T2SS/T4P/T4SS family [Thiohalophilus thiocyanatoxydans]TDY00544.1 general secretion pathway protein E [Thiohalophilus thiocyanatoxydans]
MNQQHDEEREAQSVGLAVSDNWPRTLHYRLVRELRRVLEQGDEDREESVEDLPLEAEALLLDAMRERATDIHIDASSSGILVRLRVDGRILDGALLAEREGLRLINQFKAMARLNIERRFTPEESRISYVLQDQTIDMRLTYAPTLHGHKLSIRIFQPLEDVLYLQELGLHEQGLEQIQEWIDNISGMLLVAGPTGSGKTTTLYSLLHKLKLQQRNVVTIEDPVEYEIDGINHIQVDLRHGLDFASGVKAMLRLDPDYLMLGEIREAASARAAITAATSGRALMGTLHSRDAVGVIDTLRNYDLSGQDISSTLVLVIAQRLVRKLCPHCRVETEPDESAQNWLEKLGRRPPSRVWRAEGCEQCHNTGYHGRTGIFELWRIDPQEYQLLLEGADRRTLYRRLNDRRHRFLIDDGLEKVAEGVTSLTELQAMGGLSTLPHIDML